MTFVATPIWNASKGHRTLSNSKRAWKRARNRADERFKAIEGPFWKPDTRGKELVLWQEIVYPPKPGCKICKQTDKHDEACPIGIMGIRPLPF